MEESKKYELAYMLSSQVPEEEMLLRSGEIAKLLEEAGGLVIHQATPQKKKLAYEIKKETNAYFSWVVFTASAPAIAAMEKKLKTRNDLLRYLIVVKGEEAPYQPVRLYQPRQYNIPRPALPAEAKKPEEKLDLEELDKKLEEILGK